MEWRLALDKGVNAFREQASRTPGWYWVCRPHHVGRRSYDLDRQVRCLVFVDTEGKLSGPLDDIDSLDDVVCHDDRTDTDVVTWFAGPVRSGARGASVRAATSGEAVTAEWTGEAPTVPGWHWCRTNPEAPLLLVDREGIGPVLLHAGPDGSDHVYLAVDAQDRPVDVGEFGFSEPLVSAGGVIDATGGLGRDEAVFFGSVQLPVGLPGAFPSVS